VDDLAYWRRHHLGAAAMRQRLINLAKTTLGAIDIGITRRGHLHSLTEYKNDISVVLDLPADKLHKLLDAYKSSKAQLKQDLFVLLELDFKRGGFFIDCGAASGVDLSNSYLLEKKFGWTGILVEPARCWHAELAKHRSSAVETRCVWRDSRSTLQFSEAAEFSTITAYVSADRHARERAGGTTYKVDTISLTDLLDEQHAPKVIDYLSIDTEGSEFEILNSFDFSKYRFNVITCEHNFTPMRGRIFQLLTKHGYIRKYTGLSEWDDWYVATR
jgi:FkbM family methyltransferase